MLGEIVLVDMVKCLCVVGAQQLLNVPKAERDSDVHIVGVCENGSGGFTVHAETSDPNSLEKVRAVCQSQVTRNVCVKPDPIWEKENGRR